MERAGGCHHPTAEVSTERAETDLDQNQSLESLKAIIFAVSAFLVQILFHAECN